MGTLDAGDRLVVSELSRLGRSLGEVVNLLDAIAKASVAFVAVKETVRFEGRQDLQTKVMTTLFALFAEVERDLISERTGESLARARASGKKLRRPKGSLGVSRLDGREDEIRHFLALGVPKTSIAKITGDSRPTLWNSTATPTTAPRLARGASWCRVAVGAMFNVQSPPWGVGSMRLLASLVAAGSFVWAAAAWADGTWALRSQERAATERAATERQQARRRAEASYARQRSAAHARLRAERASTMYASTPDLPAAGAMCPVPGNGPAHYSPVLTSGVSSAAAPAIAGAERSSSGRGSSGPRGQASASLGNRLPAVAHASLPAVLSMPASPPREHRLPYLPAASAPGEGIVRLVNRAPRSGEVRIEAIDDTGRVFGPVSVALSSGHTAELSSSDLERGNPLKGLWSGIGSGAGDWRLSVRSSLDLEVLAYAADADGVRAPLHGAVEPEEGVHRIGLFPGVGSDLEGRLRLVNAGVLDAEITIRVVDDAGTAREVSLILPSGTSRSLTSGFLANGSGLGGSAGSGAGDWRLSVTSSSPIEVQALASTTASRLGNLSNARRHFAPVTLADAAPSPLSYADAPVRGATSEVVWRLPSASSGVEGLLRLVNRSLRDGAITLHARDETDWTHDPVTVTLQAGQALTLTSTDLELGNAAKGLSAGLGTGVGAWRLEVRSALDVEVLAYLRGADDLPSPLHAVAPRSGANRHTVPAFGSPEGELWLINRESTPARVRITGVDEQGKAGQPVTLTVPADGSRTMSSELLSWGGSGVDGYLGAGTGRWRLSVWSDAALELMAFEGSPSGGWVNVSTASGGSTPKGAVSPVADLNGDGRADVLLRHVDGRWHYYPMDGRTRLDDVGSVPLERDLHWRLVGLGDLDGDGRDDVLLRHTDGRWRGYLMDGRTARSTGSPALPAETAWGVVGLGDLDGNGTDDVVLRHTDGRWRYAPLDGLSLAASGVVDLNLSKNLAWRFAGLGDLDGNGTDDVLLRHDDGRWYVYPMQGARAGSGRGTLGLTRNLAWSLAGLGDFNGDGSDDALLRHVNGNWTYYPLSGRDVLPDRGSVGMTRNRQWSLAGVGDFGGDGSDDVLLRHDDGRWFHYAMSGREVTERGSVPLTRNLAWTPGGGEPEELEAGTPPAGGADTGTPEAVFASDVSDPVVQGKCVNCHVAGGVSANTRLVLVRSSTPDHVNVNRRVFEDFVEDVEGGAELILNKVQGVSHGGGEQLPAGSTDFQSLRRFLSLLGQDTGNTTIAPSALFAGVRMEPARSTLRRAAIVFAGRVPTDAEYEAIRTGGLTSLRATIRGFMQGPAFHEFLIRASNDRLLTDREQGVLGGGDRFVDYTNTRYELALAAARGGEAEERRLDEWEDGVQYGVFRGPLELIAHVVENDLPYTQILTADYIMANPHAATAYGDSVSFEDEADVHEFQRSRIRSYYRPGEGYSDEDTPGVGVRIINAGPLSTIYPHAGLLNSKVFLQRYPTTPTNRNRARSRWTYYHFLGLDVEKSASRTTDPEALADTNNPTLHNPACTVCHTVLDPIAGAFQNYGDEGLYRDQWEGLDSIDGFYKYGSEDEAGWAAARGSFVVTAQGRADRQTVSATAWLRAGQERVQIEPRLDPPTGENEDVWWNMGIEDVQVRDAGGRVVDRVELQSVDPEEMCGRDEAQVDEETGEEFYEAWFCGQEVSVEIQADGLHEVEVTLWEHAHHEDLQAKRQRIVDLTVGGYQEGDIWYRDMRPPGFAGETVPDADSSLPWLAEKIVADDRFAEAAVKFWWPAVMGAEVVEAPEEGTDRGFRAALLAANAQALEVRRLAEGFRRGFRGGAAYNVKDLLVEMVVGKWFRAASVGSVDSTRQEALRLAGARRLLTPEELARKTLALTGFQWGRHVLRDWHRTHQEGESLLTGADSYRLLYGGIDSDGIIDRARDLTSVMAGVAQSHALESSCPIVMRELYLLPDDERRLFGGVGRDVSPVFEFSAGFDVQGNSIDRDQLRVSGRLRSGRNTVRLSFTNNDDGDLGDRNLHVDKVIVRSGAGITAGVWRAVDFETVGDDGCNRRVGGHYAFFCNGSIEVPVTVRETGRYVIEVTAWADRYGDEPARLEVDVESSGTSGSVGARAIKEHISALYRKMLGVDVSVGSLEVRNAYGLFVDVWKGKRASGHTEWWQEDIECDWGQDQYFLDGILDDAFVYREDWGDEWGARHNWDRERIDAYFDTIDWSDRNGVARTWPVVLAYLLMDYRYLYL